MSNVHSQPDGEQWIICSSGSVWARRSASGMTSVVPGISQYWTGSEWGDDMMDAKRFDSEFMVGDYIATHRVVLNV